MERVTQGSRMSRVPYIKSNAAETNKAHDVDSIRTLRQDFKNNFPLIKPWTNSSVTWSRDNPVQSLSARCPPACAGGAARISITYLLWKRAKRYVASIADSKIGCFSMVTYCIETPLCAYYYSAS